LKIKQFRITKIIMPSSSGKKRVGRPRTGRDPAMTIRIPKQAIAELDKQAKEQHTTRAAIARKIIVEALEAQRKR
jgi:hypothetical protein